MITAPVAAVVAAHLALAPADPSPLPSTGPLRDDDLRLRRPEHGAAPAADNELGAGARTRAGDRLGAGLAPRSAGHIAGYALSPLAGSTAAGAAYGADVSVAGDVVVVGAPLDKASIGAAFVHTRVEGTWSQGQLLVNPLGGVYYGRAVAVAGPRMIVTATSAGNTQALVGALDGTWVKDGLISTAGYPTAGADVLLRGDSALLGVAEANLVLAYIRTDASEWTKNPVAPVFGGVGPSSAFGARLATGGAALAVAASLESETGAVYLYRWPGAAPWTHEARIAPAAADATYGFGAAVSLAPSGALVAVGAPNGPGNTSGDGAVYLFRREDMGTWTLEALLRPPADGATVHRFGTAVVLTDELLAVGSPGDEGGAGRVHVFTRGEGGWSVDLVLPAADDPDAPLPSDAFGSALAVDGRRLAIGAPSAVTVISGAQVATGRAFIVDLTFAAGAPCTGDEACASGHCVDGVCCDGPCDGACEACSSVLGAMSDGTCSELCPGACDDALDLCQGDTTAASASGGDTSTGGSTDGSATAPAIELDPYDGCACAAAPTRPPALLVLLAAAARRRRRADAPGAESPSPQRARGRLAHTTCEDDA